MNLDDLINSAPMTLLQKQQLRKTLTDFLVWAREHSAIGKDDNEIESLVSAYTDRADKPLNASESEH